MRKIDKLFQGVSQRILRTTLCAVSLVALLIGSAEFASAQVRSISGAVLQSSDNLPIPGAVVLLEGTGNGTVTDGAGLFRLNNVPESGKLNVSFLGYTGQIVSFTAGKTITIKLDEEAQELDEVVVVGYGEMRKKEVTGAVARVSAEELSRVASTDLGMMLQGQVAGVNVTMSSGEPGAASNIQIRGLSSLEGSSQPLFVVDGVPQEEDPNLPANEIANIDVLKDAASAAIYGTRGAGGVILITTKKGSVGKLKVSFNGYFGIQSITSDVNLNTNSQYQYAQMLTPRYGTSNYTDNRSYTVLRSANAKYFNDTNLYDVVVNDNAPVQSYSLNASGGSNTVKYSLAANYFDQDGIIIHSGFSRYSLRADINITQGKWTINTNLSIKNENRVSCGSGMLGRAYNYSPQNYAIDPDADITSSGDDVESSGSGLSSIANILARFVEENTNVKDNYSANVYLKYQPIKDLEISTRVGLTYTGTLAQCLKPVFTIYTASGALYTSTATESSLKKTTTIATGTTWETMLNWRKKVNKHDIRATGVFSMERYTAEVYSSYIEDLLVNEVPSFNVGTGSVSVSSGTDRITTLVGMLGRVQYNYDERFLFSGSIRRDGSSRFSADNRWGMFPSVSAGWNVSEESFFSRYKKVVSSFKLRASFGTTGNQNFSDYLYDNYVSTNLDYAFGVSDSQTLVSGAAQTTLGNSDISWETTQQINGGFDMTFFKNSLSFSFDVYQSKKIDMLFPLMVPATNGLGNNTTVVINVGDMENKGVEMAAGYRKKFKKWNFVVNGTFSTNNNEITSMGDASDMYYFSNGNPTTQGNTSDDLVTVVAKGYEAGAFFVYPTNGVINDEFKLAEYQKLDSAAEMGDLIYVDTDGDGTIDEDDRVYGGSGIPEFEVGLNYRINFKNFDFYMNWYASIGNEIINGTYIYAMQCETENDIVYQWSENYPESPIPAFKSNSHSNIRSYTDIWIEDGSFIRLKSIMLGYSVPKKIIQKAGLSRLRFYVSADNLWTITKYSGNNPEVGNNGLSRKGLDYGTYPTAMQVRGGVQIDF